MSALHFAQYPNLLTPGLPSYAGDVLVTTKSHACQCRCFMFLPSAPLPNPCPGANARQDLGAVLAVPLPRGNHRVAPGTLVYFVRAARFVTRQAVDCQGFTLGALRSIDAYANPIRLVEAARMEREEDARSWHDGILS